MRGRSKGEALALLAVGWHRFGLRAGEGRLETFTFQLLLFFALFSIVSVRERGPFWRSRPSVALTVGLAADALVAIAVGLRGFAELRASSLHQTLSVIAFTAFCALGPNDLVKTVLTVRAKRSHDSGRPA